ncbi:aspartyl-tRNA synthetase [Patellaria atrata CBS 101060]|uniref:Probable aspartate--tRNA ligase, cytoplasmic n=1 Tax=Patellaria atrata CBS 101060 TaxID=1346257 RepID=A0A9P4SAG8_9PEZI|nr:aspartyl-tRNA synthetase [Patellaria atrata CBS 101060]
MASETPQTDLSSDKPLAERPKEGEAGPSKNALKKAQKEAEKAAKKAAAKAKEAAQKAQQEAAAGEDVSVGFYGELPLIGGPDFKPTGDNRVNLGRAAKEASEGKLSGPVSFRAQVINARQQGAKLAFLNFRQGTDSVQAVVAEGEKISRKMVKFAAAVPVESVVLVKGLLVKTQEEVKSASIKDVEVHVVELHIISRADSMLPLQIEDAERPLPAEGKEEEPQAAEGERPFVGLNTRLNNRVLDLRARQNRAIFRIKHGVTQLFQEFLNARGFIMTQTPKLMGAASEGGANVFRVDYFEKKAFLAQSPQLPKQMLIAAGFERVYEIGPVFRAENSNTARHLTEFSGLDLEMAFEEHYHEVLDVIEEMMLFIFDGLKTRYKEETEIVRQSYKVEEFKLPEKGKVPRITFKEGISMLREAGEEIGDFDDLSTPQEKHLGRLVLEKYDSDFYILDQFPLAIRPFYTMPSSQNQTSSSLPENQTPQSSATFPTPQYSNSYDLFMRGQEICSGAQRIHSPSLLRAQMLAKDPPVNPDGEGVRDYVQGFGYGCPPHAGAGLGLERVVMLWLGLPNVRLASLFPRDPGRVVP